MSTQVPWTSPGGSPCCCDQCVLPVLPSDLYSDIAVDPEFYAVLYAGGKLRVKGKMSFSLTNGSDVFSGSSPSDLWDVTGSGSWSLDWQRDYDFEVLSSVPIDHEMQCHNTLIAETLNSSDPFVFSGSASAVRRSTNESKMASAISPVCEIFAMFQIHIGKDSENVFRGRVRAAFSAKCFWRGAFSSPVEGNVWIGSNLGVTTDWAYGIPLGAPSTTISKNINGKSFNLASWYQYSGLPGTSSLTVDEISFAIIPAAP